MRRRHFLGMSSDEKDMFCWCLSTDLSALTSLEEAGRDEKVEMPLAALACAAIALALVAYYVSSTQAGSPPQLNSEGRLGRDRLCFFVSSHDFPLKN